MRTLSLQELARVSGGANVIGPEGTANAVAIGAGASVAYTYGTVSGLLAAGSVAAGTFVGGMVAAYNVGHNIGEFINDNSEAVRETAAGTVERFATQGFAAPYYGIVELWGGGMTAGSGRRPYDGKVTIVTH